MSDDANYFKTGLFVLSAIAIAVVGITVLGARSIFAKPVLMETYLDESVQGLERGSPVKHRGVQIGNVRSIDFVRGKYMTADDPNYSRMGRYVVIELALEPEEFAGRGGGLSRLLEDEVRNGLRVQLAYQGITGLAYLEANYFDPEKNPPLEISWEPEHPYIPSTPALFSKIGDSAGDIVTGAGNLVQRLERLDLERFFQGMQELFDGLNEAVTEIEARTISEESVGLMRELRETNARIREVLERADAATMAEDASAAVASARRGIEGVEEQLPDAIAEARALVEQAAAIGRRVDDLLNGEKIERVIDGLAATSDNLGAAAAALPETLARVDTTVARMDRAVAAQEANAEAILADIRGVSADLRELTANLKRYPAQAVFGEPPPRSDPGKRSR